MNRNLRVIAVLLLSFAVMRPAFAGSPAGKLVKDIHAGSLGSGPAYLTPLGDAELLFRASDGITGNELWSSDGTPGGTSLLYDLVPGSLSGLPQDLTVLGDQVLFSALAGSGGWTIWSTDGTTQGTAAIYAGSSLSRAAAIGGAVYFEGADGTGGTEPWITDGTTAGTRMIDDINGSGGSAPSGFTALGSRVLFEAAAHYDATNGYDFEPWITDGTAAGTHRVKDLEPGDQGAGFDPIGVAGGVVVFRAATTGYGDEIWKTDGTAGGTVLLKDINPGASASRTTALRGRASALGLVWFEGVTNEVLETADPWVSDGTASGTVMLADLNGQYDAGIREFVEWNGAVWFVADEGGGPGVATALYRSDGTPSGTTRQMGINTTTSLAELTPFAGELYYVGDDSGLWVTDGFSPGAPVPTDAASSVTRLTVVGDRLFFRADDPATGQELWSVANPAVTGADGPVAVPVGGLRVEAPRPNPARSSTAVAFSMGRAGEASVAVYDVAGRRVRALLDGAHVTAGPHELRWDGRDDRGRAVPGGVYLVRLEAGGANASHRIVLVR